MPCEQINRAALAIDGVGDLGLNEPAGGRELAEHRFSQRRVPRVEHAVERTTPPANENDDLGIEDPKESPESSEGHAFDPPAFEQRNLVLTAAGGLRHIHLTQAEAVAESASNPTHTQVVHGREYRVGRLSATYRDPAWSAR